MKKRVSKTRFSGDPRLKDVIKKISAPAAIDIGIIGAPFDFGVELSGGRMGSALAPDAIRGQILKYGTAYNVEKNIDLAKVSIADFGNLRVSAGNSLVTHGRVEKWMIKNLPLVKAVIVLGGGNDVSYPTIKALSLVSGGKIGGINVDAHFDVRPVVGGKITSGTPYYRLISEGWLAGKNFFELASQGHVNASSHKDWLLKQKSGVVFLSEVRKRGTADIIRKILRFLNSQKNTFVSIDIDSVAQAFAPGSSAPSPDGLFPRDVLDISRHAGRSPNVRLFEIMEVNPRFDVDGRTCRLAAAMIGEFITGFAERKLKIKTAFQ